LERARPGLTVEELASSVFAELAMKRTRRAEELVAEAIRMARARPPRTEITGSRWQASTQEVRDWAVSYGSCSLLLVPPSWRWTGMHGDRRLGSTLVAGRREKTTGRLQSDIFVPWRACLT
jgi:hypothetical protein